VYENGTNIGNVPDCPDCNAYERELSRCNEKSKALKRTIAAMTAWLEKNQPDVFRRGLWNAITANAAPHTGAERA
jgi:hypothetical protein